MQAPRTLQVSCVSWLTSGMIKGKNYKEYEDNGQHTKTNSQT